MKLCLIFILLFFVFLTVFGKPAAGIPAQKIARVFAGKTLNKFIYIQS